MREAVESALWIFLRGLLCPKATWGLVIPITSSCLVRAGRATEACPCSLKIVILEWHYFMRWGAQSGKKSVEDCIEWGCANASASAKNRSQGLLYVLRSERLRDKERRTRIHGDVPDPSRCL